MSSKTVTSPAAASLHWKIRSMRRRAARPMASAQHALPWGLEPDQAGRIKPLLDRALPLSQAAEAQRLVAEGHNGSISAEHENDGVIFTVKLPGADKKPVPKKPVPGTT